VSLQVKPDSPTVTTIPTTVKATTELMLAFETVCGLTHTASNPWFVIPGNDRSFRNAAIRAVLAQRIRERL